MTSDALIRKYNWWGEHPDHPIDDWRHEVNNSETRLGYWDWVAIVMEDTE